MGFLNDTQSLMKDLNVYKVCLLVWTEFLMSRSASDRQVVQENVWTDMAAIALAVSAWRSLNQRLQRF